MNDKIETIQLRVFTSIDVGIYLEYLMRVEAPIPYLHVGLGGKASKVSRYVTS